MSPVGHSPIIPASAGSLVVSSAAAVLQMNLGPELRTAAGTLNGENLVIRAKMYNA